MVVPLLRTKLYIPPLRPELVPRPRLIARLNAGFGPGAGSEQSVGPANPFARKLTVVSAPAGYGKTTLVNAWLHGAGRKFVWVSLDAGDNDLARFLNYLVAASRQVDDTIGQTVEQQLRAPQLPAVELLLTEWINDIVSQSSSFVLVLDD